MKTTAAPTGLGMLIFAIVAAIIVSICLMLIGCAVTISPDGDTAFTADGQEIARAIRIISEK